MVVKPPSPRPVFTAANPPLLSSRALRYAWSEARPIVQVIFQFRLLAVVAVASVEGTTRPDIAGVALCCAGWLLVTWSIYLFNGVMDQIEDRANGSSRPIASGVLDVRAARVLVALLCGSGLTICLAVGEYVFTAAILMSVLGFAYSAGPVPLKNFVGGVQISVVGGGMLTYAAGLIAADVGFSPAAAVFAVALSAWMGVGGLAKDLSDVSGDRLAGRSTLPMWSDRGARMVVAGVSAAVAVFLIVTALLETPHLILPGIVLTIGSLTVAATATSSSRSRRDPRACYRAFMYSQYGAHASMLSIVI